MGSEVVVAGEIERISFENQETGFRVFRLAVEGRDDSLCVVGTFPPISSGMQVRVTGTLESDARYGEQLRGLSLTEVAPSTLVGLERYLGSGLIRGVGAKTAHRIVTTFGLDTLRVLDESPHRLQEVPGVRKGQLESLAQAWKEQRAVREVMTLLHAYALPPRVAMRIVRTYGSRAQEVLSTEPYRVALEVWGVGFKTADALAERGGISKEAPERIQAGMLHTVHTGTESGDVCLPEATVRLRTATLLAYRAEGEGSDAPEPLTVALEQLVAAGRLVVETVHGGRYVYTQENHAAEVRLTEQIQALAAAAVPPLAQHEEMLQAVERIVGNPLAPEQRTVVDMASTSPLLVVTGGPGVGKTTVTRALVAMFEQAGLGVSLAAPTGRAAKRLSESTGREAMTLHRLLEFDPKWGHFQRNAEHRLEAQAVVVDEASMLDLKMADALFQALRPGTRLVLVGDVDQLPSIGAGSVLRDMLASEVIPSVRLTRIFRQAQNSLIVTNAHRIHAGDWPQTSGPEGGEPDFFLIERTTPEAAQATVVELVTQRIPRRFGFDPLRDIQVLTPMHRGPAGTIALNHALQAVLNPHGDSVARGPMLFRTGDKVMQLKNNYERNVWNGDIGSIDEIHVAKRQLSVVFDESSSLFPRRILYDPSDLEELSLAYACSIHKAQGSEYPVVVIPFLASHYVMLSRNLLYTAVTRAKKLVVLVSDSRALSLGLAEDRHGERCTWLAGRLSGAEGL